MNDLNIFNYSMTSDGYVVNNFENYEEFCKFVGFLGETIDISNIRHQPSSRAYLASNQAMNLHTDHPAADVVCWYCVQNADIGGESVFVDFRKVVNTLSSCEIDNLKKIPVAVPKTNFSDESLEYLLSDKGVYFSDWLINSNDKSNYTHLFKKLVALLNSNCISIRLEQGNALFLDNKRILHGRKSFNDGDNRRHLVRHWISYKS